MRRPYRFAMAVALLTAVGSVAACVNETQPARVAHQSGYTIRMLFDGGYFYDWSSSQDAIDVAALEKAHFPMKVQILTSLNSSGSPIELDLKGTTLTLRPGGTAPAAMKPAYPPLDTSQTGCTDNDQINSDNSLFIPNLAEVAAAMGTRVKDHAHLAESASIHLTGGGRLSVHRLGGCVQYKDAQQMPWHEKRSMASGIGGIMYEWTDVPGTSLTLVQTSASGQETTTEVKPDTNGRIVLHVSSFMPRDPHDPDPTKPPYEVAHFKDHFDDVYQDAVAPAKRISLWWMGYYLTSPGIDCPPGSGG